MHLTSAQSGKKRDHINVHSKPVDILIKQVLQYAELHLAVRDQVNFLDYMKNKIK